MLFITSRMPTINTEPELNTEFSFDLGNKFNRLRPIRCPVPFSKAEGDARVALIRECVEPWNKRCRCAAHWKYFDGWLD